MPSFSFIKMFQPLKKQTVTQVDNLTQREQLTLELLFVCVCVLTMQGGHAVVIMVKCCVCVCMLFCMCVHSKYDPVVFVTVSALSAFTTPARVCVCVCVLGLSWASGSGLWSDVIGAAGWGDMGLELGRGPDSSRPQNETDQ